MAYANANRRTNAAAVEVVARDGSLPPPGRGRKVTKRLASSAQTPAGTQRSCQRPSPNGGTCTNGAIAGGQFCKGHTCSIGGCSEGKSSAAVACVHHSSMERESSTSVDAEGDVIYHVPCGGNFYELPPAHGAYFTKTTGSLCEPKTIEITGDKIRWKRYENAT